MQVVSTARIDGSLIEKLRGEHPELDFAVFNNMETARPHLAQAEILITFGSDLDESVLQELPRLRWLYVISAGVDRVPLSRLEERGVIVTNARGVHAIQIAEYIMGALLFFARQTARLMENQRRHCWDQKVRPFELHGKTLGIVGTGAIGSETARKAKAFDLHVLGLDRSGQPKEHFDRILTVDQLPEFLPLCDFLVLCMPLTPETRGMFGQAEFGRMKESGYLVNVARGAVIRENELIAALTEKKIAGACLDVFETEPLPADSPLWDMPNVLITPHHAGNSIHYMERAMALFRHNYPLFKSGRTDLHNRIQAEKGY